MVARQSQGFDFDKKRSFLDLKKIYFQKNIFDEMSFRDKHV